MAPFVPVVSVCKTLEPGIRRIGNEYGIQFDVATSDLHIHEGVEDAPPFTHGFGLTPKNSTSVLEISYGDNQSWESFGTDPVLTFSEHFEKRSIFDEKGQLLGEDYWGIWTEASVGGEFTLRAGLTPDMVLSARKRPSCSTQPLIPCVCPPWDPEPSDEGPVFTRSRCQHVSRKPVRR